jgi:glutamate decarboxylase
LYKAIDFDLPNLGEGVQGNKALRLNISKGARFFLITFLFSSFPGTFELIKSTLKYSVNAWNPRFMDKLYAGTTPIGVISELLMAVLNANAHVYHCSPVFTLMEIEVTRAVGKILNMGEVIHITNKKKKKRK